MQELGLRSTVTPKKPAYKKGECYKKFENHLNREFHAEKPNEKWCTDFTYIFMEDRRKRYNCNIIDLYDRFVVETLNSSHIDADLAVQTLKVALKRTHYPKNLMLHSDRGSPYTSRAFTDYCKEKGVKQSMSRAGCPYDNSPMESFYGIIGRSGERIPTGMRATPSDAISAICGKSCTRWSQMHRLPSGA